MDDLLIASLSVLVSLISALICLLATRKKMKAKINAQKELRNNIIKIYKTGCNKLNDDLNIFIFEKENKKSEKEIDLVLELLKRDRVESMHIYKEMVAKNDARVDYYLNFIKAYDQLDKSSKIELSSAIKQPSFAGRKRFFMRIAESVLSSLNKFA
ncbi:TPA: hypothetical protein SMI40_001534 [Serratia liquefaciens]|uniref:hypothetical protein n=1 Tax=Serratia ureilytica TaxID=300181 RepID=UPI0018DA1B9C|nr:hypothetical protein [Serratia ureilytica]MBH2553811.1 hypothetical protein [Serratia ureilytica]HEJ8022170.1 hypothetical protein [Serratia liquefaciens]